MKKMNEISSNGLLIGAVVLLLIAVAFVCYAFISKERVFEKKLEELTFNYQSVKADKEKWISQFTSKQQALNTASSELSIARTLVAERDGQLKVCELQINSYKEEANIWKKEADDLSKRNEFLINQMCDFNSKLDSIKKDTTTIIMSKDNTIGHTTTDSIRNDSNLKGYNTDNMESVIKMIKGMLPEDDKKEVELAMELFDADAEHTQKQIDNYTADKMEEVQIFKKAIIKKLIKTTFDRLDISLNTNIFKQSQQIKEVFLAEDAKGLIEEEPVTEVLYEEPVVLSQTGISITPLPVAPSIRNVANVTSETMTSVKAKPSRKKKTETTVEVRGHVGYSPDIQEETVSSSKKKGYGRTNDLDDKWSV